MGMEAGSQADLYLYSSKIGMEMEGRLICTCTVPGWVWKWESD